MRLALRILFGINIDLLRVAYILEFLYFNHVKKLFDNQTYFSELRLICQIRQLSKYHITQ